ncbi:MAG: hypothetical protein IH857_08530 [Deltaproteobacteria bacterium]|nr:hypothetical protein [Deltaproteobacteria bacterium]
MRSFSQDDAHIFCTPEQIGTEIQSLFAMVQEVYAVFGFEDVEVKLSTRPEKSMGDPELWDKAEAILSDTLTQSGINFQVEAGEGAFYGPKIDYFIRDALNRRWQLTTIQLDFSLPERFGLTYIDDHSQEQRPVMIHRALLGSLERFIGVYLEHTAGDFPLWLAPVQVKVMTVTDQQKDYALKVSEALKTMGWRVEVDGRNEKLGYKIREAQVAKVPYALVIGDREMRDQTVSPRRRGGETLKPMSVNDLMDILKSEVASKQGEIR